MISGHSRVFAILGKPVSHSLSPVMHNAAFRALGLDAVYVALACEGSDVAAAMHLLAHAGGGGNVTVPHKAAAAAALDMATPLVRALEACNTFWIEEGALHGDNTDVAGVTAALERLDLPPGPWLVAGTGGAARGVVGAAANHGASVAVRSRDAGRRSAFERWMAGLGVRPAPPAECTVLVNATPLGLHPGDHLPIAADQAPGAIVALDLVYSPRRDDLVPRHARSRAPRRRRPRGAGGPGCRRLPALVSGGGPADRGDAGRGGGCSPLTWCAARRRLSGGFCRGAVSSARGRSAPPTLWSAISAGAGGAGSPIRCAIAAASPGISICPVASAATGRPPWSGYEARPGWIHWPAGPCTRSSMKDGAGPLSRWPGRCDQACLTGRAGSWSRCR